MLIVNESLAKIDDVIDKIVASFLSFDQVNNYKKAQADFEADIFLQEQLKDLLEKNQLLAENEAYLPYRPELKELQREIRGLQREVNLNEHVYKLRLAENDLQGLLADLTRDIAATISEDISIDEGLPFSKKGHHGRGNLVEVKFELQKRRALYVYYNSYKHVRRLKKYGDFVYTSKRLRYVKIYVNEEDYEQIKAELAGLHFVKGVEESFLPDLEMNFSEEY